jgi:alpha-glucosidase (family GH31 glycosyl hydrolase)
MSQRSLVVILAGTVLSSFGACGDDGSAVSPVELTTDDARVVVTLDPFELRIFDAEGRLVLGTVPGDEGAYGAPGATVDSGGELPQLLPGWDGYEPAEAPWRHATQATLLEQGPEHAIFALSGPDVEVTLEVGVDHRRVRLTMRASEEREESATALNKSALSFRLPEGEHFFGLGERFASTDHRGLSLYSWAEEGALGLGEDVPAGPDNPAPNGPSMTYFPVPFFLSSQGYGFHVDTTFRSELHFGSEDPTAWRVAVGAPRFSATVYVSADPLTTIDDYTADTGRPMAPAPWVFGPRRRVGSGSLVDGQEEFRLMREQKIPVTGVDDAVHFLPALSQLGREDELSAWTRDAHALGYKVMAYNNPYVAANEPSAALDYAYGKEHGFFVKGPDGEPQTTAFISGKLLEVAAIDLTNPDAVLWFQGLLRRTLELGYDGWMHDFGEYTRRDAVFFDGRRGAEMHNLFPVLSAKAAHDLLEAERPGDYLFFVRSGYSGTQAFVPAVWGGDAEATFDETQGLPSSVRSGLNLAMSGVPYWGSDMTGFKCLTDAPNDKEVFLRWVELGAVSPIMMEQNACSNPVGAKKTKWSLWNDQETIDHYRKYAGLHTRLLPYFLVLRRDAVETGRPLMLHPFLLHPDEAWTYAVEDAFYLGPALYASPVVRRGVVEKQTYLPPGARYVDLEDYAVYEGGGPASIPAPVDKLPLLLVSDQLLPLLDPSIETLGQATDPSVVSLDDVADRLDVVVALTRGGSATITLDDGTMLTASRDVDAGNPGMLTSVDEADIADCASCFFSETKGGVERLRASSEEVSDSDLTIQDLRLSTSGGPARRVRWDVLRLP